MPRRARHWVRNSRIYRTTETAPRLQVLNRARERAWGLCSGRVILGGLGLFSRDGCSYCCCSCRLHGFVVRRESERMQQSPQGLLTPAGFRASGLSPYTKCETGSSAPIPKGSEGHTHCNKSGGLFPLNNAGPRFEIYFASQ